MAENNKSSKSEPGCPGFQPSTARSCLCYYFCFSMLNLKCFRKELWKIHLRAQWNELHPNKQELDLKPVQNWHNKMLRPDDVTLCPYKVHHWCKKIVAGAYLQVSLFCVWYCALHSWMVTSCFSYSNLWWNIFVCFQDNFHWLKMFSFTSVILCTNTVILCTKKYISLK